MNFVCKYPENKVCLKDIRPSVKKAFRPVFAQKILFMWGS
jgi:hypothetical protein